MLWGGTRGCQRGRFVAKKNGPKLHDESPKGKVTLEIRGSHGLDWRDRAVDPTKRTRFALSAVKDADGEMEVGRCIYVQRLQN